MSNFLAKLLTNLKELITNPLILIILVGCTILLLAIIKFKSIKFDSKMVARIGLAIALTFILDMIKLYSLPNGGGSLTLGSMIPILLIAYMYGPIVGMFTGFLFGIFNLILDPYILNPVQVLFDYPLPAMMIGLAGFFKNKYIGASVGMLFKFIMHFISGVVFFGEYAPEGVSPYLYSLGVNGFVVGLNLIICLIILYVLPVNRIISIINKKPSSINN